MNYDEAGVRYEPLDAFKRACQRAASTTADALKSHGFSEPKSVRGESAYLLETPTEFLAHVEEGLGTKNLIADAMLAATGKSYYRNIGIDTVATIVNDLITCGALPISVAMHAAVGDAGWFEQGTRAADLAEGFAEGCRQAAAVWGGGETPALRGLVLPEAIVLAGSAVGRIAPKSLRITGNVQPGDAIIFFASSGVHTNGLTLCRAIADKLPQKYLTPISDGRNYGEALLDPSIIYVKFIAAAQQAGLKLNYTCHLTGHGWRKLMRLDAPFVYRITEPGGSLPIFDFLELSGIERREMYATFNMGVGFVTYINERDVERCLSIAQAAGYRAWRAGTVESEGLRKAVEIDPLGITFESDTLNVR